MDIATRTCAIVVALGHITTGVFGTSQAMVDAVVDTWVAKIDRER